MKSKNNIFSLLNFFFFTDVTNLMKSLRSRQANDSDLTRIKYINETLKRPDSYPNFRNIRNAFCKSPLMSIIQFERQSFLFMFFLHTTDVIVSLLSIYLSMEILSTFNSHSILNFKLILFFSKDPSLLFQVIFTIFLALLILALNLFAAGLHAQKIEREMLLAWRIPIKVTQAMYDFILNISAREKEKYSNGDITNIVQNDTRFLAAFFAHGFVDLSVIILSGFLITTVLFIYVGSAAWFGIAVILLQIPIALLFAWLGAHFHKTRMQYGDKRIHRVTELIQGMRTFRYLNWGRLFARDIQKITNKEFIEDTKLNAQFCLSFALIVHLWMFISTAVFAGYLLYENGVRDASVFFGVIWLSKLFGQQITPLPWFFHTLSQAFVASKRLKDFFLIPTQQEEFTLKTKQKVSSSDKEIIQKIINNKYTESYSVSCELDHVWFRYLENGPDILKDLTYTFKANKTVAILGMVGSGKSTLLKILLGEYLPTKGNVYLIIHLNKKTIKLNLHSDLGLALLRSIQSYVPQESFVVTSTLRENVMFSYAQDLAHNIARYDNSVMNSLYQASLAEDLTKFPDALDTEIGERGVNLSGGQKQRISLARKFYKDSDIIFMDDPFSAVDTATEDELVEKIFSKANQSSKTIIWTTHRTVHLSVADQVLMLESGRLYEQ